MVKREQFIEKHKQYLKTNLHFESEEIFGCWLVNCSSPTYSLTFDTFDFNRITFPVPVLNFRSDLGNGKMPSELLKIDSISHQLYGLLKSIDIQDNILHAS